MPPNLYPDIFGATSKSQFPVDGYEAAVSVVDEELAVERARRVVVDAAGAVGDVGHDDRVGARVLLDDVGQRRREHRQALRQLQRHPLRLLRG